MEEGLYCAVKIKVELEVMEGCILMLPQVVVKEVVPCVVGEKCELLVGGCDVVEQVGELD